MANIKSQVKRNRQNEERRRRNRAYRQTVRTHLKQFRSAVDAGDRELAETKARAATRQLDKAVARGTIHRNYAANKKSKMARDIESL